MDEYATWKHQRIKNTYKVPLQFEKFIWIGYLVCLDTFLDMFTSLPIRVLKHKKRLDIMLLMAFIVLLYTLDLDIAYLYHFIRGQSVIKLYVIFNTLEIADKLCASFGLDIVDVILVQEFNKSSWKHTLHSSLYFCTSFLCLVLYGAAHSIVLLFQLVALNVAVNSHNNALLTLLISNQFAELKTSVFKKFEAENLFQLGCSDIVERLHLTIFLLLTFLRNLSDSSEPLQSSTLLILPEWCMPDYLLSIVDPLLAVIASEFMVDWIKHAFITKFNGIKPNVYQLFSQVIARDILRKSHIPHATSRRLGFGVLPASVLVLSNLFDILPKWFEQSQVALFTGSPVFDNQSYYLTLVLLYGGLWIARQFIKQTLFQLAKDLSNEPDNTNSIGGPSDFMYAPVHAIPTYEDMPLKGKSNKNNFVQHKELNLETIDRFSIWKSRVPT